MKLLNLFIATTMLLAGLVFLPACGENQIVNEQPKCAWCRRRSGAFDLDGRKVFHGVGAISAKSVPDPAFAQEQADAKARTEIARIFNVFVQSLNKQYQRATSDGENASMESDFMTVTKQFTEMELAGVEIVDTYYDENLGIFYSLARMDLERFADFVDKAEALGQRAKEAVQQNAAAAFDELERESSKRAEANE